MSSTTGPRTVKDSTRKTPASRTRSWPASSPISADSILTRSSLPKRPADEPASEGYRNFFVIEWNGEKSVLRNFDDPLYFPGERETGAALKRLLLGPARAAYVTRHGERSAFKCADTDHQLMASARNFRDGMRNQGFDVEELGLDAPLLDDLDLLVIVAPRQAYTDAELAKLQAYIARGGNLLVAGEPGSHEILNPIVESFGVEFIAGSVVEPKDELPEDFIYRPITLSSSSTCSADWGTATTRSMSPDHRTSASIST